MQRNNTNLKGLLSFDFLFNNLFLNIVLDGQKVLGDGPIGYESTSQCTKRGIRFYGYIYYGSEAI